MKNFFRFIAEFSFYIIVMTIGIGFVLLFASPLVTAWQYLDIQNTKIFIIIMSILKYTAFTCLVSYIIYKIISWLKA